MTSLVFLNEAIAVGRITTSLTALLFGIFPSRRLGWISADRKRKIHTQPSSF